MATINILDLKDIFLKFNRDLERALKKDIPEKIKKAIISDMNKGISPVKGHRWVKYSDSYAEAIQKGRYSRFRKRVFPVNLKLSGKLQKSLDIDFRLGFLVIEFKDEKAEYHDKGTDKLPQRKILPNKNEQFNDKIQNVIDSSINKLVKKYFQD